MTRFEPPVGGEFRYEAVADIAYPENSASAEAERRQWLERYLRENSLCPAGYEITERRPIFVRQAVFGPIHRIHYRGRCKS